MDFLWIIWLSVWFKRWRGAVLCYRRLKFGIYDFACRIQLFGGESGIRAAWRYVVAHDSDFDARLIHIICVGNDVIAAVRNIPEAWHPYMKNAIDVLFCAGDRIVIDWRITAAHYADLLIDVAIAADRTAHYADLISGKLVAWVPDYRPNTAATLVLNPTEAENVYLLFTVYDTNISVVWFRR